MMPRLLHRHYWTLKRLTIIVGFGLTLLGTVGSYTYIGPAEKRAEDLDGQIKSAVVTIESLKNADAAYWMFQQQGSLIFAIYTSNTKEEAKGILGDLMKLAIYDRTFAIRTVIGQLAIANQLNYRETSDRYQGLIDQAAKDFSFGNYMAINQFEKGFMQRAEKLSGDLQQIRFNLIGQKGKADRQVERRKLVLLVLTTLGSTFLLAANLISTKDEDK